MRTFLKLEKSPKKLPLSSRGVAGGVGLLKNELFVFYLGIVNIMTANNDLVPAIKMYNTFLECSKFPC